MHACCGGVTSGRRLLERQAQPVSRGGETASWGGGRSASTSQAQGPRWGSEGCGLEVGDPSVTIATSWAAPSQCLCSHLAGPEKLGISRCVSSGPPRRSSPQCRGVRPAPRAQGQPEGLFITSLDSGRLGCFHRLAFCLKLLRTGVDKIVFRSLLSALWGQTLLFWKIMHR